VRLLGLLPMDRTANLAFKTSRTDGVSCLKRRGRGAVDREQGLVCNWIINGGSTSLKHTKNKAKKRGIRLEPPSLEDGLHKRTQKGS